MKEAIFHPEARAEVRESVEFYEAIIDVAPLFSKPKGLYWSFLAKEKIEAVPVLKKRQRAGRS